MNCVFQEMCADLKVIRMKVWYHEKYFIYYLYWINNYFFHSKSWSEIEWRRNSQHHIIQGKMRWRLRETQQLRNPEKQVSKNDAFESSSRPVFKNFAMGWRFKVKNDVMGSLQRMKILSTTSSYRSKKIWLGNRSAWWATKSVNFLFGWMFCFQISVMCSSSLGSLDFFVVLLLSRGF